MTDAVTGPAGAAEETAGAPPDPAGAASGAAAPSEEELRAAYEAELSRITSADLILQTAASLLNLGAHRLGLTGEQESGGNQRDLEQVRDAIDGVRGLMPILERRCGAELSQLRDALSQLQMAYAREASAPTPERKPPSEAAGAAGASPQTDPDAPQHGAGAQQPGQSRRPGPAEASGRLWVPGR